MTNWQELICREVTWSHWLLAWKKFSPLVRRLENQSLELVSISLTAQNTGLRRGIACSHLFSNFRVDSSEISFQLCGQGCAEQILSRANKAVIEPIMNVEVVYPQEFDDRVNKYLYEKHADIQEFELDNQVILAFKWVLYISNYFQVQNSLLPSSVKRHVRLHRRFARMHRRQGWILDGLFTLRFGARWCYRRISC